MPSERILIDGQLTETLCEHLRPGLRAVFVGLNPTPVSVSAGHYYQGQLGRRFWRRVMEYGLVPWHELGTADEFAITLGYGFADLVRRPTARAKELSALEKSFGALDLVQRLRRLGDRPPIIFVFKESWRVAATKLEQAGFRTLRFPAPFAPRSIVHNQMRELQANIGA